MFLTIHDNDEGFSFMDVIGTHYNDVLAELKRRRISVSALARLAQSSRQTARDVLLAASAGITPRQGTVAARVVLVANSIVNTPVKYYSSAQLTETIGE